MGFLGTIIPAAMLFQELGDLYAGWYPVFAANRADKALPSWTLEYISHFARYSLPALPLFILGIYGYRSLMGVSWLAYDAPEDEAPPPVEPVDAARPAPLAALIDGSRLPADAEILAIKAEQHYIRIWSDQGKDLVRFRFKDVPAVLADTSGDQVHRSWWANLGRVETVSKAGRSIELCLPGDIHVPVSLAYRNTVLRELGEEIHEQTSG